MIDVPDPLSSNEPATKQYGDRNYLTNAGFVMQDNIGMGGHTVTNLGTPTNDTDAANKKCVDGKKCKFKDGATSVSMVDLRDTGLNGTVELYNNITFVGGAYCRDLGPSRVGKSIVNKKHVGNGSVNHPSKYYAVVSPSLSVCGEEGTFGVKREAYQPQRYLQRSLGKR